MPWRIEAVIYAPTRLFIARWTQTVTPPLIRNHPCINGPDMEVRRPVPSYRSCSVVIVQRGFAYGPNTKSANAVQDRVPIVLQ
jgi:hypothetical protein